MLHAIFFFRKALAGNFFFQNHPPAPSRVKWSAPKWIGSKKKLWANMAWVGEKAEAWEPVDFVFMPPSTIQWCTRFSWSDSSDCWLLTYSTKNTHVHANVIKANEFKRNKHSHTLTGLIALLTCYCHMLHDHCKWVDGRLHNKFYRLPHLYSPLLCLLISSRLAPVGILFVGYSHLN